MITNTKESIPQPAKKLVEAVIGMAHLTVARGQHPPTVFLINSTTNEVQTNILELSNDLNRAKSIAYCQAFAEIVGADMTVMVSEGWALPAEYEADPERFMAERRKYGGRLENHPKRQEVLFVTVEAVDTRWMARSRIRTIKGHRTFDDMDFISHQGDPNSRGAFDNFLAYRRKAKA